MPLSPGTRVGLYVVGAPLGAGGMGEVYSARDTRLDRDVALKVLPESLTVDAERLARFEREARVLASLNHPNIAAIYGVEDASGPPALVMELVDGPTLADRIAQKPLPLDEALQIARQIAEALEAAHEAGFVHRDLKPANIKVRGDGTVKVLDFGLAKASQESGKPAAPGSRAIEVLDSPTITSPVGVTGAGVILGTAAYMSPEQATGRAVDRRADIWAFGLVLYEMLSGRRAFEADNVPETLAAVLTRPIDLSALPGQIPPRVRTLIADCLVRDARQRLRDIGEARRAIDRILSGASEDLAANGVVRRARAWRRALPWTTAGAAITAAVAFGIYSQRTRPVPSQVVTRSTMEISEPSGFVALSADGRRLAYSTSGRSQGFHIAVRELDRLESDVVPGTEDGRAPVFSPDGQSLAYTITGGKIRRASLAGGGSIEVSDGDLHNGAAWGDDDTIVFSGANGLMRVPASGGSPTPVTAVDVSKGETAHVRPQSLPGRRGLLFTIVRTDPQEPQFAVLDPTTGLYRIIARSGDNGRYVPSGLQAGLGSDVGHLTYGRDQTVFAVPFDLENLAVTGPEVPVVERVSSLGPLGTADYAFSNAGVLVYSRAVANAYTLAWMDRSGASQPITAQAEFDSEARTSPDGTRIAGVVRGPKDTSDLWVLDTRRGTTIRLTFSGVNQSPIWTPDGGRLIHGATDKGASGVFTVPADASATSALLFPTQSPSFPAAITPDGRTLVYIEDTRLHVRSLAEGANRARSRLLHEGRTGAEQSADFSLDGRWLAYTSNESGAWEAYVEPFPGPGGRERVSTNGARFVRWTPAGRELVYWAGVFGNLAVVSVPVQLAPTLQLGQPQQLFSLSDGRIHDVAPDGKRLLTYIARPGRTTTFVTVTGWFEELRRLAPARR